MTTPEMASVAAARIGIVKSLRSCWRGPLALARRLGQGPRRGRQRALARAEPRRARGPRGRLLRGLDRRRDGSDSSRGDPSQRLIGKPSGWVRFQEADVVHYLDGRLPSVRAQAVGRADPLRPAVRHQCVRHARRPGRPSRSPTGRFASPSWARRSTWAGASSTRTRTSISSKSG